MPKENVLSDTRLLKAGSAFIWLATALLVLTPSYQTLGAGYLDALHLPHGLMYLTCLFELALGLIVLLGPASWYITGLQCGMIGTFTIILVAYDPYLLVNPFGMLTKNFPLLATIIAAYLIEKNQDSPLPYTILRWAMALIWVSEGLMPKILFQQSVELEITRRVFFDMIPPSPVLTLIGLAQISWGIAALFIKGRALQILLFCQFSALIVLPLLIGFLEPSLFTHPFGPLTKNASILAGTFVLLRRCSQSLSSK